MSVADDYQQSRVLVSRTRKILAGKPPQVVGLALADLLATLLAGHVVQDDPCETERLRRDLLASHIEAVRELIPVNASILQSLLRKRGLEDA